MSTNEGRIKEEHDTVAYMIHFYCEKHHHTKKELCTECQDLLDYASQQLFRCQYGEAKPVCSECQVHCYRPEMRTRIRTVMRYAGPRMVFYSPRRGFRHLYKKWRSKSTPRKLTKKKSDSSSN